MTAVACRRTGLLALILAVASGSLAWGQPLDILSGKPLTGGQASAPAGPESIVSVSAQWSAAADDRPATLLVTARIEPPWYAYSTTQKSVLATPTLLSVDESEDYRLVGEFRPDRPPSIHRDLGAEFEVFENEVTWMAPIEVRSGVDPANLKISGKARIQVCRKGECLQPTVFPFTALLAAAPAARAESAKGVYAPENIHATIRGRLEPKSAPPGSTVNLIITAEPAAGWHTYERADRDSGALGYKPTLIVLTNTSGFAAQATKASSAAVEKPSDTPGVGPLRYHEGAVTWSTPIVIPKDAKPGKYLISGLIGYQTCRESECDLPRGARFEASLSVGRAEAGAVPLAFSDAKYGEAAKAAAARPPQRAEAETGDNSLAGLPMIILASLVGGFILNFMPCVLPVIGLKILSFAEQAGRSRAHVLALNVWYSLGTLSVFMILATLAAGANLGLREENLAWGEQFTSPSFTIAMSAVVFVMALSFLGVWEIPIPGFVGSGAAGEVAAREGAIGAFVKGALTTVLSTPCSGPLLGAVFAYALNQPTAIVYTIFGSIGLGMCAPYLVIGAFPALIRFLPKPGVWMDTFKQMMGFVMLFTLVFLFSVLKRDYLVATFALLIGLWAACWWIGRTSLVETLDRKLKAWAQGAAFAALVGYLSFTYLTPHASIIPWQPFSQAALAQLQGEGKTVMIDFTANWCATCKFNLFTAIETEDVRSLLEKNHVVPLLADWTEESAEIKSALESLHSASIPLLAVFPANGAAPIIRRDVITKKEVLEALHEAGPSREGSKPLAASVP